MQAHKRVGVLVATATALAIVAAASQVSALDAQPVTFHQTADRTEGRCAYHASIEGTWAVDGHAVAHDVVVTVDSTITCRGEAPSASTRQLYYSSAPEAQIVTRMMEVATREAQISRHRSVTFVPAIVAEGDAVRIADVRCEPTAADTTTATR